MSETNPQPANSRDERGRFRAGGPGGPGRPPRSTEEEYARALQSAFTLEEATASAKVLIKMIHDANEKPETRLKAIALLWRHVMPQPQRSSVVEVHASEASEFRIAGLYPSEVDARMLERIDRQLAERGYYSAAKQFPVDLFIGLDQKLLLEIQDRRKYDNRVAREQGCRDLANEPQLSSQFQALIAKRLEREDQIRINKETK